MGRPQLDRKTKLKYIRKLIDCTRQIIDEQGLKNVTIRNIADLAGLNSATIYNYFHDLDELVTYACISSFKDYAEQLHDEDVHLSENEPEEVYLMTWEYFSRNAFSRPREMYLLFFGKYSNALSNVFKTYYEWFPEEKQELSLTLQQMLADADIFERNILVLRPLINGRAQENELSLVNELTVSYFQMLLREMANDTRHEISAEMQTKRMMNACVYLLDHVKD